MVGSIFLLIRFRVDSTLLILGGAVTGVQNLIIAGMVIISLEILYVVIEEDRRVRALNASRDG